MKQPTYQILHTFINRYGRLQTRVNSSIHGGTDAMARECFDQHVRFAENAWAKGRTWNRVPVRITGIVLIDAAENVLAEWTHQPVKAVAA